MLFGSRQTLRFKEIRHPVNFVTLRALIPPPPPVRGERFSLNPGFIVCLPSAACTLATRLYYLFGSVMGSVVFTGQISSFPVIKPCTDWYKCFFITHTSSFDTTHFGN